MTDQRKIEILEIIIEEMTDLHSEPFDDKTLTKNLLNQEAAILGLAKIVKSMLEKGEKK